MYVHILCRTSYYNYFEPILFACKYKDVIIDLTRAAFKVFSLNLELSPATS